MAYQYFLSYSRENAKDNPYFKDFVVDLNRRIRERLPVAQQPNIAFWDQDDIELGADWKNSLVQALNESKVFLAITSPAYFESEYCGKEWAVFCKRLAARPSSAQAPALLKPVRWIASHDPAQLPPAMQAIQYAVGPSDSIYNTKGLTYLLRRKREYETEYENLLDALADDIAFPGAPGLPSLAIVPQLKDVTPAFPTGRTATGNFGVLDRQPVGLGRGANRIRFVYAVAQPEEVRNVAVPEAYEPAGAGDWRPFFPEDTCPVHVFMQGVVASDLKIASDELACDGNLVTAIEEALRLRQIVILIVDRISLQCRSDFRVNLSKLDCRLDYHWSVLMPGKVPENETEERRAALHSALDEALGRHAIFAPNPLFFRDGIHTAEQLKSAVCEIVIRLKDEIRKRVPIEMPVPAGPSRAILSGPTG